MSVAIYASNTSYSSGREAKEVHKNSEKINCSCNVNIFSCFFSFKYFIYFHQRDDWQGYIELSQSHRTRKCKSIVHGEMTR